MPPLLEWLGQHNITALCDEETASCLLLPIAGQKREELAASADMMIVLGGDGTLLAAARAMAKRYIPILPVNLGGLGFLTSVTLDDLYTVLELVLEDKTRYSERVLLETQVMRNGQTVQCGRALNDVVVGHGTAARIIDLDLRVNDEFVSQYKADGLIISTPTGSTAYSLAAGGPIVYPTVSSFLITPICPHMLTNRPLVIPNTAQIEVTFPASDSPVVLTLDGQVPVDLAPGDRVVLHAADERLRLVRAPEKTYFSVLRDKLKWGER